MSKRERQELNSHWVTKELFQIATELFHPETPTKKPPNFIKLEALIINRTSERIPASTLKYWYYGNSHPKINEVELIAKALGYELDLMMMGSELPKTKESEL